MNIPTAVSTDDLAWINCDTEVQSPVASGRARASAGVWLIDMAT